MASVSGPNTLSDPTSHTSIILQFWHFLEYTRFSSFGALARAVPQFPTRLALSQSSVSLPYEAFPDHHPSLKHVSVIPFLFSSGTFVAFNHIFIVYDYLLTHFF